MKPRSFINRSALAAGAIVVTASVVLLSFVGCSSEKEVEIDTTNASLPEQFFLSAKPEGALSLAQVKEGVQKGQSVVFDARVGGRREPFVDGRAVMVVIDPEVPACSDKGDDHCPTPWDYCCETPESLLANMATVQLVDGEGKPFSFGLSGEHGIEPLARVTVVGDVSDSDASGLFVVNATGMYIEKP